MKALNVLFLGLGIILITVGVSGTQAKIWDQLKTADSSLRKGTGTSGNVRRVTGKPANPAPQRGTHPVATVATVATAHTTPTGAFTGDAAIFH